jgi:purine-binding chemotaxis protein CheW
VICLRQKFGMPETEVTQRTCLIVVQIQTESVPVVVGAIVDSVAEVVTLSAGEIEDTPDFGNAVQMPYILGMAKSKGRVRILLDIDAALSTSELQGLDSLSRAA